MIRLGVNIDHVATLRQARRTWEPDPVQAAFLAERAGADGITVHLREDRRHIQDRDISLLMETVTGRVNLEMGMAEEIIEIALAKKPYQVTLVPERREEVTTEGGLNVRDSLPRTKDVVKRMQSAGIQVSLFVDPEADQLNASAESGAEFVELHTGCYGNAWPSESALQRELVVLQEGATLARSLGLRVNGGHGLTYLNVQPVAAMPEMEELNIGHSIVSRAVMTGIEEAVREMKRLITDARDGRKD